MCTQHKGLLPELVQSDGINNHNKRINKNIFWSTQFTWLELRGWSAAASATPWVSRLIYVVCLYWDANDLPIWVKIDIFTCLLKQVSWGVQLSYLVNLVCLKCTKMQLNVYLQNILKSDFPLTGYPIRTNEWDVY